MATRNEKLVKEEIVVLLRNSDVLSTTQRGVTTQSDSFTATAGQTIFTLTKTTVRNIRSVTVNANTKYAYKDFTPTYNTGTASTITFLTGLTLNDAVVVSYDYSSGTLEKVFPDYPQIVTLVEDAPRIGFDIIATTTKPIGIGNTNWLSDSMIIIKAYDLSTKNIDTYISTIRSYLKTNQLNFYHFKIAYPSQIGPPIPINGLAKKVFEKDLTLYGRFGFES